MEFIGERSSTGEIDGSPATRVAARASRRCAGPRHGRGLLGPAPRRDEGPGRPRLRARRPLPYNVLAQGERIVIIDLPQVLDLVANPHGTELLLRDCRTMCVWFRSRGSTWTRRALRRPHRPRLVRAPRAG
ncbi:RIO1 family regulatory kinase/ATPase [Oerskovia sp. M15]